MKLKKVIAAVTAAAVAIGSLTAYSIVSPKFSLSAEAEPEEGKIIVDTEENSGLAFAFYDRAEDASGEPIGEIEDETNKYAVEANTEILAVVTLSELLEDGKKLSVFYGGESENFFENDKITFSFSFTMPEEGIVVGAEIKDLDTYNIIATVEDGGTGSVTINGQDASEGVQAAENSEVIVEAQPAEGYEVGTIMVITDRETFGIDSGDSFVMPSGDVEVRVTFVDRNEGKYAISKLTYRDYGIHGTATITVNGVEVNRANPGDIVTVTFNTDEYYISKVDICYIKDKQWHVISSDPSNENLYTFEMPEDDVELWLYVYGIDFNINTKITDSNMGSAYVVIDNNSYLNTFVNESSNYNKPIKIIAVPAKGYKLDTITVVDSDDMPVTLTKQQSNCAEFYMPASDVSITVNFTERDQDAQTYMINTVDTENGLIIVNSEAEEGETISICCKPDIGYNEFGYAIAEITVNSENGDCYSEEDLIKEATCSYNYVQSHLYTFTMPASNITIDIKFMKLHTFYIEYCGDMRGCYWGLAIKGDKIIPYDLPEGYVFENIYVTDSYGNTVDITIEGNEGMFIMPDSDVTGTVTVKEIKNSNYEHSITIIPTENGSVTADRKTAESGNIVTLTVTPEDGYAFDSCSVIDSDGNPVDTSVDENEITFTMPDSDVTVTVTFKEIDNSDNEHKITITPTKNGSVTADRETAKTGDTVTLIVSPDEDYWPQCSVTDSDGNRVRTSGIHNGIITFTMPDSDVTVTVIFYTVDDTTTNVPVVPAPEVTSSETETPAPEEPPSGTETPAPEEPPSETETHVPEETTPSTETPDPDPGDGSEDLTIDIDEENKITGNDVIQAGGDVKPGETVDITDEDSDASASVKLPDNAESGLSFIITNKTDEIIDSANRILAEAVKIVAEKAKSIKSTIENILNNKSKGFAYELKFTDSSGNTAKVEGAFVKVALPIPENLLPENTGSASFFAYHATAGGFEKINSIFNAANNTVEFAATSFSPYLITLEEITGGESENTVSTSNIPSFVIPALTLSSTEANSTGSVTAAPIPTASLTSSVSTTVPPAAADASPEANATPIDSADNMGKPDSENAADTTRDSSSTSSMGFADTNAATGLALELIPLLSVTAIGILASRKKK